jgi:hypothetical protein
MASNVRRTGTKEVKAATKGERERSVTDADPIDPAELVDTPTDPDGLGPQGEGGAIPEPDVAAEDHASGVAGDKVGSDDLTIDRSPAGPMEGFDAKYDPADLDEFLEQKHGYGGADGRNPASDSGGPTQPADDVPGDSSSPIGGNPYRGLEGAAGKLPAHQQAYLDQLRNDAQTAAANGDFDAANDAAAKTEKYLVEIGQNAPPSDDVSEKPGLELVSNYGSGSGGPKQVWDTEKQEIVMVPEGTETDHQNFGSEGAQMKKTGTNAGGNQDTPSPDPNGGLNEDRGVEGDAPDFHSGFTELYRGLKLEDALGGDIDPNPTDDSAGTTYDGPPPSADPTDVVANYGEDYNGTEADTSRVSADDAVPDEEFFET